jgi:hypothetical protein
LEDCSAGGKLGFAAYVRLRLTVKHNTEVSLGKSVLETAQFGNPTHQRVEHGISWLTRRLTVKRMFPNLKICVALRGFR